MTIATFSDLKSALDAWLDHTLYQSREDDFITLAEAWMNRNIAVREQVTTVNIATTNGVGTIPADYIEWIRLTRQTPVPQILEYLAPDVLQLRYPRQTQVIYPPQYPIYPAYFTIEGSSLITRPIDDSAVIEFVYYAKIPALSLANPTNWMLTAHPDLYLWATLTEASVFGTNDARGGTWKSRRDEVLQEVLDDYAQAIGVGAQQAGGPTP